MGPRLKGFFMRQGAAEDLAEDLTQNVYLRVLQGLDRYQQAGRLDAFFLRIARNLWIDHRRRRHLQTGQPDLPEPEDPTPGPVEQVDFLNRREILQQILQELEPESRELVELAILQKLPYKEVSDLLQIPVGTVKSRVFYTLKRLRDRTEALLPENSETPSNPTVGSDVEPTKPNP